MHHNVNGHVLVSSRVDAVWCVLLRYESTDIWAMDWRIARLWRTAMIVSLVYTTHSDASSLLVNDTLYVV